MENHAEFDAIVVGSGITGGWAAKELTEAGLKVLVLERGDNFQTEPTESSDSAGQISDEELSVHKEQYFIQSQNYMFSKQTRHIFNNDKDDPYIKNLAKPFNWFRTNAVGGKSLLWGGGAYRWSDLDFNSNKLDGYGIDWPIRYRDLEKWYAYVENYIGVSGQVENLPQLPDGVFLPPMELTDLEKKIKASIENNFDNRTLTIGRVAVLTVDHNGRHAYPMSSTKPAWLTDALFTSKNSTLPAAHKTGNLTLLANTLVEKLNFQNKRRRITSVSTINTITKERVQFNAKLVFLCASTIASTKILLNSACDEFPHGLANTSGVLGHYLMDHFGIISAIGAFPERAYVGAINHNLKRPTISHIPRFQNLGRSRSSEFIRGYGYVGWEGPIQNAYAQGGFGQQNLAFADNVGASAFTLMGFGECLPYYENKISINKKELNRFGIPQVNIDFSFGENEEKMAIDMATQAYAILEKSGFSAIKCSSSLSVGGDAIHEMGTARMGNDPNSSLLNQFNQSHDIPNLFVTDGSCMTSSSHIHPSLTYMALTVRACAYAITQLRLGAI